LASTDPAKADLRHCGDRFNYKNANCKLKNSQQKLALFAGLAALLLNTSTFADASANRRISLRKIYALRLKK
jgi:hypothetical protein